MSKSPAEILADGKTKKVYLQKAGSRFRCTIRERREALGLTLKDVERGVGFCSQSVWVAERGGGVSLAHAMKLATFFGMSIEELWPEMIGDAEDAAV